MKSNRFVQDSWVEFHNMDFNGAYMHMNGAIRTTQPEAFYNPSSKDTLTIYFFGGSTMFGFNVLDHETIPSQFVQQYKEKFPFSYSTNIDTKNKFRLENSGWNKEEIKNYSKYKDEYK